MDDFANRSFRNASTYFDPILLRTDDWIMMADTRAFSNSSHAFALRQNDWIKIAARSDKLWSFIFFVCSEVSIRLTDAWIMTAEIWATIKFSRASAPRHCDWIKIDDRSSIKTLLAFIADLVRYHAWMAMVAIRILLYAERALAPR